MNIVQTTSDLMTCAQCIADRFGQLKLGSFGAYDINSGASQDTAVELIAQCGLCLDDDPHVYVKLRIYYFYDGERMVELRYISDACRITKAVSADAPLDTAYDYVGTRFADVYRRGALDRLTQAEKVVAKYRHLKE